MGEGSSWLLLGRSMAKKIGDILAVEFRRQINAAGRFFGNENILSEAKN